MSAEREQQPRTTPFLPHQRRASGHTLTVTGRALRFLGYALATGCGSLLLKHFVIAPGPPVSHIPWALRLLIMLGVLEGGWLVFRASRRVVVRGRRHRVRVITGFGELRGERYILYLRPFAIDARMSLPPPEAPGWWMRSPYELPGLTMEDFLVRQFTRHGRVVAVGEPGEELPLLGAQRGYLPLDGWERTVSELIQGAHCVLMSVAPGPGTVWEFTEALRTMPPERLVLMVCCGPEEYDAFRTAVVETYAVRKSEEPGSIWAPLPRLPACPARPPASKREWQSPLRAFVTFDRQWQPSLHWFVVTVPRIRHVWTMRRLVREGIDALVGAWAALPQRQAAPDTVPPPAPVVTTPPPPPVPSPLLPQQPLLGSTVVGLNVRPPDRRTRRRGRK